MATANATIKIKRGTNAQRMAFTPAMGEQVFVTDYVSAGVHPLYIGDGSTVGGIDIQAALASRVTSLEALVNSNDVDLDTLQEIVAYIKQNRQDIANAAPNWSVIQGKPATFPADAHNHDDRYYTKTAGDARYLVTEIDGGTL